MARHPRNKTIQFHACEALGGLAADKTSREAILRSEGIERLLKVLTEHKRDVSIQVAGYQALNVLTEDPSILSKFEILQIAETVLYALKMHPRGAGVQEHGFSVLINLADFPDVKTMIVRDGGIERIIATMKLHPTSCQIQCHGCTVLKNVAISINKKRTIIHSGGVAVVVAALTNFPADVDIQIACYDLFRTVLDQQDSHELSEEIVKVFTMTMKNHQQDAEVLRQAFEAMVHLPQTMENRQLLGQAGVATTVATAVTAHPSHRTLRWFGERLVNQICSYHEVQSVSTV
uniref:LRRK2 ARM repeat domain-containing protein n=1 Tax=Cyclophora tenuis TaxID=216820 RepID=A0A7S1GIS1_CYCTE